MAGKELLFDGNEKQIFATENPEVVRIHFKDNITAFNNIKKARVVGKGIVDNSISSILFSYLESNGIKTHFLSKEGEREQLCRKINIVPLEIIVRNYIAGTSVERLNLEEGMKCEPCIIDIHYNNERLGDPLVNDSEIIVMGIASSEELKYIYATALKVNGLLQNLFGKAGIKLIDIKLEFGRLDDGSLVLSDEISPDTCRLWDAQTDERLDKDRFRMDMGYIVAHYQEVLNRLENINKA